VEGKRGGKLLEWGINPGERPDREFYKMVNKRFQEQALNSLRELAKGDKPFFLNYWPQIPVAVLTSTDDESQTPNGGRWANAMAVVDGYVGELLDEITKLGIEDNTIVFVMGDNSPYSLDSRLWFTQGLGNGDTRYRPGTVPRDYLIGKAFFVYWPSGFRPHTKVRFPLVPNVGNMRFIR